MARGGNRPGAGRPKGASNARTREAVQEIEASGLTPLQYLTSVYQDDAADAARRIDAAKAAAPYVHAKLNSVELSGPAGGPVQMAQSVEWTIIDSSPDDGSQA